MFYNLKIAIRNLRRNGVYSAINISGLTVSLAACILITLWVFDELSYDGFHANKENLYMVNSSINSERSMNTSPSGLAVYAKAEIPEIKEICRIKRGVLFDYFRYGDRQILNDNSISMGAAVDSSFFRMFSFPLIDGDPQNPFIGDFSVVLSESIAKAIFGNENPMGKAVRTNWGADYFYVTGIMKDMPENSSIKYDYLVPFSLMKQRYVVQEPFNFDGPDSDFLSFNDFSYFELYPESNLTQVEQKLKDILILHLTPYVSLLGYSEVPPVKFILQQITEQHLYNTDGSPGGMAKVRLFAVIAGLILVIACINYVNLVTARTGKRTKEMGVRRLLGAKWLNIIWQSLQETCVMLGVAIILASVLIWVSLPAYNFISGKNMEFDILSLRVLIIYGITIVGVLALAGIYPSLYLASINSQGYTKNKNKHVSFRRVLVVFQFVCSIVLIVSTIVITLQMNFIREKDLGYNRENVICFAAWGMKGHIETVRNELQKNPDITGVATASFDNMLGNDINYVMSWQGREKPIKFSVGWIDFDFLQLMDIRLVDGQEPPVDSGGKYCLINKAAVSEMKLEQPLNQIITHGAINQSFTVSGIIEDFNFESLYQTVSPLILVYTKEYHNNFYVKTTTQGTKSALASIEKLWKEYCPDMLLNYSFLDENFERLYKTDIRMGKLLYIFAFIAIVISCLGLFGLVTFTAETKTKEIGIRKVLGASVSSIMKMLSKEFLILVAIAMLLAFPLAYYWLEKMLQDYAYRINIGWWIFALAGLITVALTLLTVGWKAFKAATANPVEAIKSE